MDNDETLARANAARERYAAAAHAMQSGVKYDQELLGNPDGSPKHLRVGVNSALVTSHAMFTLLKQKNIITDLEYLEALADAMEAEVARYEEKLTQKFGKPVKLG